MTDPTFDWDAEIEKARSGFFMELQHETIKGQPLDEPYIEGCMDGFERALTVVKALAIRKILG